MSRFEDEVLLAYVDGELDAARAAELEAAMDGDPVLAGRVARHMELRTAASGAFAGVLDEPVPERLILAAGSEGVARPAFGRPRGFGLPQWAAMAACLVAGVLVGRGLTPAEGPVAGSGLEAQGVLAEALDDKLSAEPGPVRVGFTFRDAAGDYCRTFQAEALAGVACREDDGWGLRVTAAAEPQTGQYRTAGAAMPPAVLAYVDGAIAGTPLDRDQEVAAREANWR